MDFRKTIRLLYLIFLVSGISGLIYQTVWLRVLSRILGSTVQASAITISAFMLGLTLGSYLIGRYSSKVRNKILFYAFLEAGIAITAFAVFLLFEGLIPLYRGIFEFAGESTVAYRFLQATVLFILILLPTFLMGGTLPLLCSAMRGLGTDFTRSLSYLYGVNTLGAMAGVLLSGFILIGSIGEFNTILVAIAINVLAGILVFTLAGFTRTVPGIPDAGKDIARAEYPSGAKKKILAAYAVIGFTSFALEIIWIRIFQLPLGTAIYSFSTVLTIYLLGSALGSYAFGKFFPDPGRPFHMLAMLIAGVAIFSLAGMFIFSGYVPWMSDQVIVVTPRKFAYTFLIIFPVTFLVGLMFPLVTKTYVEDSAEPGGGIGTLFAANTLGCILGSLFCGFIFIPAIGTKNTVILLALINTAAAWWVMRSEKKRSRGLTFAGAVITVAIIAASAVLPDPYYSVIFKSMAWMPEDELRIPMHKETSTCTVTAYGSSKEPREKYLLINGIGMTTLVTETKLMAHLPLLLHHEKPADMLIICYGMGTSLRSAVAHKSLRTDVVELVGEEYEINDFYHANGKEILSNPRVRYFTDDGRNFLLMRSKKYDVITIDPAPPVWSAGTVNLYTTEFFALCRERLHDDGIACLWIPPSPVTESRMIMKSFISVFPNTELYRGPGFPGFYMIGYKGRTGHNPERFAEAAGDSAIMADLNEWDKIAPDPSDLLKLKIKSASALAEYLVGVPEVTDDRPYTEFPLWRKLNDPSYGVILQSDNLDALKAGSVNR